MLIMRSTFLLWFTVAAITAMMLCSLMAGGVTLVTLDAGTGASSGDLGSIKGPAVPALWRVIEEEAGPQCDAVTWADLGALGFLVSGSGRRGLAPPPPWWRWSGGAFGVAPSTLASARDSLVVQAREAKAVLCQMAERSGSLGQALSDLTGSAATSRVILVLAGSLEAIPNLSAGRAGVVAFAASALGLPYLWGGNGPSSYDCSGLVVAAFRSVGVSLPRTAQEQFDASVLPPARPTPGDLVFFGSSPSDVGHVGIVIQGDLMIDAPHTGAFVRIEPDDWPELIARRAER